MGRIQPIFGSGRPRACGPLGGRVSGHWATTRLTSGCGPGNWARCTSGSCTGSTGRSQGFDVRLCARTDCSAGAEERLDARGGSRTRRVGPTHSDPRSTGRPQSLALGVAGVGGPVGGMAAVGGDIGGELGRIRLCPGAEDGVPAVADDNGRRLMPGGRRRPRRRWRSSLAAAWAFAYGSP